jgi:cytochrome c biogenesis protein CcdA/thiol-disulfide isomerase/thioredoxin
MNPGQTVGMLRPALTAKRLQVAYYKQDHMTLFILSFIAGVLTVLAPCILPLLPIVLGGSVADAHNKKRPFVIITALGVSVFVCTFLLKVSTLFINVPQTFWTTLSAIIVAIFGLALLFPTHWDKLIAKIPGLHGGGNELLAKGYQHRAAWWGDIAIGAALGPIFTTCSPTYFLILATVLPQSFWKGAVDVAAYVLGLAAILLAISALGQRFVGKLSWAADPQGWFKRGLGALFVMVSLVIGTGLDKVLEANLLNAGFFDVTKFEQSIGQFLNRAGMPDTSPTPMPPADPRIPPLAPVPHATGPKYVEIADPSGFVNSDPFQLKDLIGKKVVLLDFMTYSCINCQRTFPALNQWYKTYKDQGLEIVGIHTPEFAFEKNRDNVVMAAKKYGLEFPLVLDNDYGTWNAYGNQYWPHKYLIDIHGNIVYDHIGEGGEDETQTEIVKLLNERQQILGENVSVDQHPEMPALLQPQALSPETYFGAARNEFFGNGTPGRLGSAVFTLPSTTLPNQFNLGGKWDVGREFASNQETGARMAFKFDATNVYLVAEANHDVRVQVLIDGKPIDAAHAGEDVKDGMLTIHESRLYHLYTSDGLSSHTLELIFKDVDGHIYTLTFG